MSNYIVIYNTKRDLRDMFDAYFIADFIQSGFNCEWHTLY